MFFAIVPSAFAIVDGHFFSSFRNIAILLEEVNMDAVKLHISQNNHKKHGFNRPMYRIWQVILVLCLLLNQAFVNDFMK